MNVTIQGNSTYCIDALVRIPSLYNQNVNFGCTESKQHLFNLFLPEHPSKKTKISPFLKANQGNQQICRASGSANVCLNVKFQNSFDVSVKVSFFYSKSFDFGCIGGEEKMKIFLFFKRLRAVVAKNRAGKK